MKPKKQFDEKKVKTREDELNRNKVESEPVTMLT